MDDLWFDCFVGVGEVHEFDMNFDVQFGPFSTVLSIGYKIFRL